MSSKSSPSLIKRFSGRAGKVRLIEALRTQELVAGDQQIATKLAAVATRHEYPANCELMRQGNCDNDIYFIISGLVSVKVNGREVATRTARNHIGEMALLDTTAKRSATISTTEPSVLAKVCEAKFAIIANDHPELWRRVAITLADRLRERNRFQTPPRNQPVVFIGSSSEGLKFAGAIAASLRRQPYVLKPWTQGVFECSQTIIEDLMQATRETDFAILVLTTDDITRSRGNSKPSPRDNVIFELGLFMGALGRERTYIVAPKGLNLKIPTDLMGLNCLLFQQRRGQTIARSMKEVTRQLRELINKYGPI